MLAYLSARHAAGRFLLRIEDLTRRAARAPCPAAVEDLAWFGLRWDAPPLYQSERTAVYQSHLERLRAKGLIYPCFCTRAQLQQQASAAPNLGDTQRVYAGTCAHLTREEIGRLSLARSPAMRVRVPDEEIRFVDGLQGPQCENLARDCGDFIVRPVGRAVRLSAGGGGGRRAHGR